MTRLRTPIVTVITGEGGSGGALAIAVGDVVLALENAVYSVISPEGCASILWRTADEAPAAALAMRMTAADQLALGVVDVVVPEPARGRPHRPSRPRPHRSSRHVTRHSPCSSALPLDELIEARYRRYRALGAFTDPRCRARRGPRAPGVHRPAAQPARRLGPAQPTVPAPASGRAQDEPPAREEV